MSKLSYYFLVQNYEQGLQLHQALRAEKINAKIAPTPRVKGLKVSCGMSVLVNDDEIIKSKQIIEQKKLKYVDILETEPLYNAKRDQFG